MKRGPSPARPAGRAALIGMAELHDLSYGYEVAPLLRLLSQEAELIPDLLRARPWLPSGLAAAPQQVLETLLEQEWAGFVARLGRVGPWVFAPSVADLQALSGEYSLLVEQAARSRLEEGRLKEGRLEDAAPSSLLGRLQASGELSGQDAPAGAEQAEAAFWALAEAKAARRRQEWAARRSGQ